MDIQIWFVSEKFVDNFIFKWVRTLFAYFIAVVSAQLKGFNYCYLTQIILFNVIHFFTESEMVTSITI